MKYSELAKNKDAEYAAAKDAVYAAAKDALDRYARDAGYGNWKGFETPDGSLEIVEV